MKLPMVCWGEAEDAALDETDPLDGPAMPDGLEAPLVSDEASALEASGAPVVAPDALEESDDVAGVVLDVEEALEVSDDALLVVSEPAAGVPAPFADVLVEPEEPAGAAAAAVDGSGPTPSCA